MPRTAKGYRLVPATVPARSGKRGSVYAGVVDEFAASGEASVLVEMGGVKAATLAEGLRKAAAAHGGVKVVTRRDQVYLTRA